MKKTFKTTAAILAAIMAMSCASAAASAMYTGEDTEYEEGEMHIMMGAVAGGWEINESGNVSLSSNHAAKAAFGKATAGLMGVNYQPIALLGTQVVAGTNYAILVRSTVVYPDAQPEIKVMYIYEDLQGNVEVTGFQTIIGEQLMGGFTANSGKLGIKSNKDVYSAYKKAVSGLTGVSYTPAAYLGSQVVAGTNYMILCRSKVVYPGAAAQWSLVKVYKDLKGNASFLDAETLELSHSNIDNYDDEGEGEFVQVANPWQEYATVAEAAKAAGVEFTAPEKLGNHKLGYIQAMQGLVDLRYTKGENVICVRKGSGLDDISGDYNEYKKVTEKKINGFTVTLKGNGKGVKAATWNNGKDSFAVVSDNLLTEAFMESIISSLS